MKGFTILELLVVVVIIAILTTISIPLYQGYQVTGNRTDAMALLSEMMLAQERYFTENITYTEDLTELGYATATNVQSEKEYYSVTAAACAGLAITNCVELTAVALGMQVGDGNLMVNSRGEKTGW